jgi:hypothetical protein
MQTVAEAGFHNPPDDSRLRKSSAQHPTVLPSAIPDFELWHAASV